MKIVTKTLLVLVFIFSCILASKTIVTNPVYPDSWLHIGAGRFILDHGRIPSHTDISSKDTEPSLQYVEHSWLSDAFIALPGSISTTTAALFLLLPCLGISMWLLYLLLRKKAYSQPVIVITLSVFTILLAPFWKLHPLVFCTPLLLLLTWVFEQWHKGKNVFVWIISGIFLAWANLWGGYVAIPILYSIALLISHKLQRSKGKLSLAFLAICIGTISTLMNPIGPRIWIYHLTANALMFSKKMSSTLTGALLITNQNYTKNSTPALSFSFYLSFALFSLLFFIILSARKKGYFKHNLYLLATLFPFGMSLIWIRFIPFAVAGGMLLYASVLNALAESLRRHKQVVLYVLAAVLALSYVLIIAGILGGVFDTRYPQPVAESMLIKRYNLPNNVLTSFDITPYVYNQLYPRKILIDAQDDMLDENEIINFYATAGMINDQIFNSIIDQNHINTALVTRDQGNWAFNLASRKKDWALIYFDTDGYLFVRRKAADKHFIKDNALNYVDLTRSLGYDPNESTASAHEMEQFVSRYPDNTMARGQLATMYRIQQKPRKAEDALLQIPIDKWDYTMYTEMGRLKAAQGQCTEAEMYFLKALDMRTEQNYSRTVLDLGVLYAVCFNDKVKAKHYFQRYNSFPLGGEEKEKLRKLTKEFGIHLEE